MKAFGTGMAGGSWQDIDIIFDSKGAPHVELSGGVCRFGEEATSVTNAYFIDACKGISCAFFMCFYGEVY